MAPEGNPDRNPDANPAEVRNVKLGLETLSVTAFQQNCTLISCGRTRRAVIVDPGGEAGRIQDLGTMSATQVR